MEALAVLNAAWSIVKTWWPAIVGAALLAVIGALVVRNSELSADVTKAKAATAAEQAAHQKTVDDYRAAAAEAAKADAENVARAKSDQQAIDERTLNDFQARLTDSDARYQQLRNQADAYTSSAGSADVSATRDATCHAYANTSCDKLPGLLKAAQDNTDQLLSLIDWANSQAAVKVDDGKALPAADGQ